MTNHGELKYFLYARKSSESEDRQMASIEDQKAEVQKIAYELGLNIVGVFTESKSAKAPGRIVFNEMMLRLERNEADAILCWKLNRLARNPVDGGKISWLLQNSVIKHIQCYGRDYKPSDNVLMMQVELGMANQFVKDLSVDVQRGMRQKAERGWNPFATLPAGYLHNKDKKGLVGKEEIIMDTVRFPIVRKLWELLLTGSYSISDIKREGDELGLINGNGNPYALGTYHKLFSNEFYCGYFYWKDANGKKQRYKGLHKPMVTQEEFDKVQCLIDNYRNPTRAINYNYPYKGLLNCGECGRSITAERKFQARCTNCRTKFSCINRNDCPKCGMRISAMKSPTIIDIVYYRCTKWKTKCSQKCITETDLEEQYQAALKKIEIPEDFYFFAVDLLKEISDQENIDELNLTQRFKKRQTELENRLQGLAIIRADGDIDREQYQETREKTLDEIKTIQKEISQLELSISKWTVIAQDYLKLALNAAEILKERDVFTKRSLLLQIASNQTLIDQKLHFIRVKPLLAISNLQKAHSAQNTPFEPKKHLMKQGDLSGFGAVHAPLLAGLNELRTSIIVPTNRLLDSA